MSTAMAIACGACGTAVEADRMPRGWKRYREQLYCKKCWGKKTIVRAVTFPVLAAEGMEWKELNARLTEVWGLATRLANWAVTELAKSDVTRTAKMEKLPKRGPFYLYGRFGKKCPDRKLWEGATKSAGSILRSVERSYDTERINVIWYGSASLRNYRMPTPYPVHNQSWKPILTSNGRPAVDVTLPGGRLVLLLRSGPEFRRQLAGFRILLDDPELRGEVSIYRRGTGSKRRVMVKMVGRFLRKEPTEGVKTMLVRTDPATFWVAEVEGRSPWIVNADHVKRWQAAHGVYRQRIGEDTKHEKRWPRKMRENINKSRELRCQKHHDRIDSWNHEATAMLVKYAQRQGVSEVIYDDSCRSYLPAFRWHDLKTKFAHKLDAAGIAFVAKPGDEDGTDGIEQEGG
jgi:hypothetical protein